MRQMLLRSLFVIVTIAGLLSCSEEGTNTPDTVSISGVVQKAITGESVEDAKVTALRHDNAEVIGSSVTNAEGAFTIAGLPRISMDIRVEAEGYAPVLFEDMDPATSLQEMNSMSVQMNPVDSSCCSGVLTLVVRDSLNNPIKGALVLVRKGSKVIEDPRTDANGRIVVDGLCAGHYNYRISIEGYKVVEGEFDINENCDPVTREVTLQTVASVCCDGLLTVTVKDPQGQPIAGTLVKLWKNGMILKKVTTNASGVAVFTDLCKGEYGVDVIKDGWTDREFVFAINENCDPVNKTVVMEQMPCCDGVLTLVVRDSLNNPIKGALVLVRKGSKVIEDPRTDANGRIVVDGLCAGNYNYRISIEGYKVVEGEFVINENCDPVTREVNLTTESICCSGVLKVVVVDSANAPIEGATVRVWRNGSILETGTTNSSGKAVFDGLCVGGYAVDVNKTGLKEREFEFAINVNCDPYVKTVELVP